METGLFDEVATERQWTNFDLANYFEKHRSGPIQVPLSQIVGASLKGTILLE